MFQNTINFHFHTKYETRNMEDFTELYNIKFTLTRETRNCGGEQIEFTDITAEWTSKTSMKRFMEGIREFAESHEIHWPVCKSVEIEEEEESRHAPVWGDCVMI